MKSLALAMLTALAASSQLAADPYSGREMVSWSAQANGPGRFVAAHGQRAAIMGYPETGLEIWAYPLQLLSDYQIRFREKGRIEPFEGAALLDRVEQSPSEVVRIYTGPDFVVREHLFVPLNAPAAILTYEVEGRGDVDIEARFKPSLNLMWPGALGGQDVSWNDERTAYVEREPVHGFSAFIGSAETVAHDLTVNVAAHRPESLALVITPKGEPGGARRAQLVVAQDERGSARIADLAGRYDALRSEVDAHYAAVLGNAVEITTPERELNRAIAASILAVEEAWVCAPRIGCGTVGGYGPSRPGRRPQYAWFFAGDGLVAVESFLASGRFERARDELEFIARYQSKSNGMIWHEMSTSAPLIDWEKRYPYMFVHVDITLQYLSTLSDYVETTGDTAFLRAHWSGVQAAWRYARSLVSSATGLPSIPAGKEGQSEQAVVRDDVRLSTAWIEAADGFARLARTIGDPRLAREGDTAAEAARRSVARSYWDPQQGFWYGGHTASGQPVREQRPDAVQILLQHVFTDAQANQALDRLATPEFQTDWGVRSLSADHANYDPNAYASGAVWGLGSSGISTVFWKEHRPFTAWNAWHGLLPWFSLDSTGHMHEVLAGDLFHPELESVPEQTWSSAGFASAAIDGLLGLEIHGASRRLSFAPHLPGDWDKVEIKRIRVGSSRVDLHLREGTDAVTLEIDNPGPPISFDFEPQIPLGARLLGADVNGSSAPAAAMQTAQDEHAKLSLTAGSGLTRVIVRYNGGVRIAPVESAPLAGDSSVNLKLISAALVAGNLKLNAYASDAAHAAIDLFTPMTISAVQGADLTRTGEGRYRLVFRLPGRAQSRAPAYVPVSAAARLETATDAK